MKLTVAFIICMNIGFLLFGQPPKCLYQVSNEFIQTISNSSIICLGEQEHGKIEPDLIKSYLIKELVLNYSFEAIIFESSFVDNWAKNCSPVIAESGVFDRLYPIWHTSDVIDLFKFLGSEGVEIYGCDIQGPNIESSAFTQHMSKLLTEFKPDKKDLFLELEGKVLNYQKQFKVKKNDHHTRIQIKEMQQSYQMLKSEIKFETNQEWVVHCINNRIQLLELVLKNSWDEKIFYRDKMMSENIEWLLFNELRGKKVLIWAADSHISKDYSYDNMIFHLNDSIKKSIYSLAIKPKKKAPLENRIQFSKENSCDYYFLHKNKELFPEKYNSQFDGVIFSERWRKHIRVFKE